MSIYQETEHGVLYCGDCLEVMKGLADNSVDSIVTDPPYELGFMGKAWDNTGIAHNVDIWRECLRVLKPGGHLLSFGGSRTYHRLACAIEDAGFEIRDQIMWIYGSGFPKSLNIGKQSGCDDWKGWGTALKPAHEPIVVARKPISEKNIAENVLKYGTGGLNIDGCRVETDDTLSFGSRQIGDGIKYGKCTPTTKGEQNKSGRFPANVIHDGSDEVMELFPETNGKVGMTKHGSGTNTKYGTFKRTENSFISDGVSDSGSAARFFYCAKASKAERDAGCEDLPIKRPDNRTDTGMGSFAEKGVQEGKNHHPTASSIWKVTRN